MGMEVTIIDRGRADDHRQGEFSGGARPASAFIWTANLTRSAALIGSILTRFFVAAYTAFTTAGTMVGVLASPIPPGFSWLSTMWTSTTGISSMRMGS